MELLHAPLRSSALVVAIDPGKVAHRVWVTSEHGLIGEPVSLPVLRSGIEALSSLISASQIAGPPVIAIEATGGLHQAWVTELERRYPGSVRLFAPSQTQAARAQLGSRRRKTDDARPTIATAPRWSGWPAKAPAGQRSTAVARHCWPRSAIGARWSPTARRPSSGCTTSSTGSARGCQPRQGTAARSSSRVRPGRPCWPARSRSAASRPASARSWPGPQAA
jgi:hypothetical protein